MDQPNQSLLDVIPGYREAIARESAIREEAFLGASEFIRGVEVMPFTLLHMLRLTAIQSPFVVGNRPPVPADVELFLWCVSPIYPKALQQRMAMEVERPKRAARWFARVRKQFGRRLGRKAREIETVKEIADYVSEAFQDAPGGKKSWTPDYYSPTAGIVARLSAEFHWSVAEILNMPLKQMFQFTRWLTVQNSPRAVMFNPSDRLRGEYLKGLSQNN